MDCVFCVNKTKIKRVAEMIKSTVPPTLLLPPFSIKEIIKQIIIVKNKKQYRIELIETDIFPYQAEAVTFVDRNTIKILFVKNYEKYYNTKRKNWTLMHELSHICLGHVFLPNFLLSPKIRWYLDKEANKLVRDILLPQELIQTWLFKNEQINPMKINCLSEVFGVSYQAVSNTLLEYCLWEKSEKHECPFFSDKLECVSQTARKKCLIKNKPYRKCLKKSLAREFIDVPLLIFN